MKMPNGINRFINYSDPMLVAKFLKHKSKETGDNFLKIIIHDFNKGSGNYTNNLSFTFGNELVLRGAGSKTIYLNNYDERELIFEIESGVNGAGTEGYKIGLYSLAKITFEDNFTYTAPLVYISQVLDQENAEMEPIGGEKIIDKNIEKNEDMPDLKRFSAPILYSLLYNATIEIFPRFYNLNTIECMISAESTNYGHCENISINDSEKSLFAYAEIERRTDSEESVQLDICYEKINDDIPRIDEIYWEDGVLWKCVDDSELVDDTLHLLLGGNGTIPNDGKSWGKISYDDLPEANYLVIDTTCTDASKEDRRVYCTTMIDENSPGENECVVCRDNKNLDGESIEGYIYKGETHTIYAAPTNEYNFVEWRKYDNTLENYEVVSTNKKYTFAVPAEGENQLIYAAVFGDKLLETPFINSYSVGDDFINGGYLTEQLEGATIYVNINNKAKYFTLASDGKWNVNLKQTVQIGDTATIYAIKGDRISRELVAHPDFTVNPPTISVYPLDKDTHIEGTHNLVGATINIIRVTMGLEYTTTVGSDNTWSFDIPSTDRYPKFVAGETVRVYAEYNGTIQTETPEQWDIRPIAPTITTMYIGYESVAGTCEADYADNNVTIEVYNSSGTKIETAGAVVKSDGHWYCDDLSNSVATGDYVEVYITVDGEESYRTHFDANDVIPCLICNSIDLSNFTISGICDLPGTGDEETTSVWAYIQDTSGAMVTKWIPVGTNHTWSFSNEACVISGNKILVRTAIGATRESVKYSNWTEINLPDEEVLIIEDSESENSKMLEAPIVCGEYNASSRTIYVTSKSENRTLEDGKVCSVEVALCSYDGDTIYDTKVCILNSNDTYTGYRGSAQFTNIDAGVKYIKGRLECNGEAASEWSDVYEILC